MDSELDLKLTEDDLQSLKLLDTLPPNDSNMLYEALVQEQAIQQSDQIQQQENLFNGLDQDAVDSGTDVTSESETAPQSWNSWKDNNFVTAQQNLNKIKVSWIGIFFTLQIYSCLLCSG